MKIPSLLIKNAFRRAKKLIKENYVVMTHQKGIVLSLIHVCIMFHVS